MRIVRPDISYNLLALSVSSKLLTMDIKLISCFLLFMVLFTTNVHKTNAAPSAAQTLKENGSGVTKATTQTPDPKGNGSAVTKAPTQTQTPKGNGSAVTKAPTQTPAPKGNGSAVTKAPTPAPAQQASSITATKASGTTTQAPKQCVKGSCTAKGDDESCLKNIQGKCLFAGSCTKDVTTNGMITVGCGIGACPTKPATTTTTTVKPSTLSPSTTTSTCCETPLCNQYQTPQSAAFGLRTNMFYVIGLLIVKVCM